MVLRLTPISPQDTLAMENAFPQFADGDVQITITSMHRYKLHSATLRRVSPLLAKLLSEQNAKRPTKRGATIRYRLILIETDEPENAYSTGASDVLYTLKLLNDQDNLQAPINDPYADHFSSAWIEVRYHLLTHTYYERMLTAIGLGQVPWCLLRQRRRPRRPRGSRPQSHRRERCGDRQGGNLSRLRKLHASNITRVQR